MGGNGGRIWIFMVTPSRSPLMSVTKHARLRSDDYGQARSVPKHTDDFPDKFEMDLRNVGAIFPIGKICRCIVEFTPRV
jgi:hypothetical protein